MGENGLAIAPHVEDVVYVLDDREVTLTEQAVRNVVCNGREDVPAVQIGMFMAKCRAMRLDMLADVIPTVYGDGDKAKIAMVVTKDAYMRRAFSNPRYRGFQAGVVIVTPDGALTKREGEAVYTSAGEFLLGGWAAVYADGYDKPVYSECALEEYAEGKGNGPWRTMPGTMIRKVALVHALREAFPDTLGGLYTQDEMEEAEQ